MYVQTITEMVNLLQGTQPVTDFNETRWIGGSYIKPLYSKKKSDMV